MRAVKTYNFILDINVRNLHKINLKYEFNIIFDEDTIYMENMLLY